ncbi:MAG TPA: GAF domain-containing sensor histidine kinase [Trebonia sp.]|nr:GAF domain-containing sensor histidine kinase [Trebonia sp.]
MTEPGGMLPQLRLDELLSELQARLQAVLDTRDRMRDLLEAVVAIGSGLELEAMLRRIVEAAVSLVDAKYGALGVIGEDRQLAQFIPVGISEEEILKIHHWPEGRGLLGLLVRDPHPLRLAEISSHAESSGFPDGHPVMRTFLGVPVRARDHVFGNLYLSEKRAGGEFTEDDETILVALGSAAGIAIENARLYEEARRQQRWVQASAEVTTDLLSGQAVAAVLTTLTRQALELSGADIVTLEVPDDEGQRLTVTNAEGDGADRVRGLVIPIADSLGKTVLATGQPLAVIDVASEQGTTQAVRTAMAHIGHVVMFPIGPAGHVRGVLVVGRRAGGPPFAPGATALVASFAAQAGVALELATRRAEAERLSVFEDRDRIARDLHDLVIQRLYATGMSLEGTMPLVTRPEVKDRVRNAVDAMDDTIKVIRASIFALQARGAAKGPTLRADIFALTDEMTQVLGFAPALRLGGGLDARLASPLAEHGLAVLREALSNVARHAHATKVDVTVEANEGYLTITVADNGGGITPGNRRSGLANMTERARSLDGDLTISPGATGGTELTWRVPLVTEPEEVAPRPAAPPGRYPLH